MVVGLNDTLMDRLTRAINARSELLDEEHHAALRLFNGFYEGCPQLVVDLYARTLVLFAYADDPDEGERIMERARGCLLDKLPWVDCVVQKNRAARDIEARRGKIIYGGAPAQRIEEHGIWYAVDLLMNQDSSFYLDTRGLRGWLLENAAGWRVLNTFAYTGSLGVAALAGGAHWVEQVDRHRKFLELARRSGMLNHLDIGLMKLRGRDFFNQIALYKRQGRLFNCVIVDPPFFSSTKKGIVDLVGDSMRLINKVRPLVADGGRLLSINNALFVSGADFMGALQALCADGYLSIEATIPVPPDITGYPETVLTPPPLDPAPFNHPTKIVVLRVTRKSP